MRMWGASYDDVLGKWDDRESDRAITADFAL
jgi:hypothetical protein